MRPVRAYDSCAGGARRKALIWVVCTVLMVSTAACSRPDNASGAGGVSAGEARALDDAAQMLDSQHVPPGSVPQPSKPAAVPAKTAPLPAQVDAAKPAG